jgi:type VI secretion system protein ImpK
MTNGYGRRRGPGGPGGGGRRPGGRGRHDEPEDVDFEDADEFDDDEEPTPPARGRRASPARGKSARRPPARSGGSGGLFGGSRPQTGARRGRDDQGFDWSVADQESREDEGYEDDRDEQDLEDEETQPRRRPAGGKPKRRLNLVDLCTPIFGYAAILPRDAGGIHPGYQQFRQEVVAALDRIEREAAEHRIEREDVQEACYALALFMDEQVADSEWTGKVQWSSEPLNIVRLNDPEGGLHFFEHLDALGNRQRAVKKVYLVCLALGFRGKFGELDPAQQVSRLGEIRQKVLRSIQEPLETRPKLFPEGYVPAVPLEVEAPPVPPWWFLSSLGAIVVIILLWVGLWWWAGQKPKSATDSIRGLLGGENTVSRFDPASSSTAERGTRP